MSLVKKLLQTSVLTATLTGSLYMPQVSAQENNRFNWDLPNPVNEVYDDSSNDSQNGDDIVYDWTLARPEGEPYSTDDGGGSFKSRSKPNSFLTSAGTFLGYAAAATAAVLLLAGRPPRKGSSNQSRNSQTSPDSSLDTVVIDTINSSSDSKNSPPDYVDPMKNLGSYDHFGQN